MSDSRTTAVVIGGGPAGLMAAETLLQAGIRVELFDAMPSVGRKFLRAGVGGLNLTHSEPFEEFLSRYGDRRSQLQRYLEAFGPQQLRGWIADLGFETFIGSSGRVFPVGMSAAPVLRAWRRRLATAGLVFHQRHRWLGWSQDEHIRFTSPRGEVLVAWDVLILALGGASWPQLGSDGGWVPLLKSRGVPIAQLRPSNCGFNLSWSEHFRTRFQGQVVKPVVVHYTDPAGEDFAQSGEVLITADGIEGGPVYALSARLREHIAAHGRVVLHLDLAPDLTHEQLSDRLSKPQGSRSLSSHLRRTVGISGIKAGLLWEFAGRDLLADPNQAAAAIKRLPLPLISPRPIEEAISSAGGVAFEGLDENLMLRSLPGVFCAGEMLDWEAPTGGYLLTACFATGLAAGLGASAWLQGSRASGQG